MPKLCVWQKCPTCSESGKKGARYYWCYNQKCPTLTFDVNNNGSTVIYPKSKVDDFLTRFGTIGGEEFIV